MKKFFAALGVINWKTTATSITALIAAGGIILNAYRTKDFATIFTQSQTMVPIIILLLTSLGFLSAKDSTVTGVGTQAATVDAKGELKTVDDVLVGTQPVEKK